MQDNPVMKDKTILITGGTGSFGTALTRVLLEEYEPRAIRIYSRGEMLQYEMKQKFDDKRLRFLIGDVRDRHRLQRAMDGVDIVVHAAAIKHIPIAEYNVYETVKTNIEGSANVTQVAIDSGVNRVMLISTDKATHPVNLYGATKMVAEKLFVQANVYASGKDTKFSCTRYGNVIGSRGSVIPLFLKQKEEGLLTITDPNMTRFWLTLEQGVQFVLRCLESMQGGEIFIPKIPSMKITDLADVVAAGVPRKVIGLRAGEKMHEMLISREESTHTVECDGHYVIEPEFAFWKRAEHPHGNVRMKEMEYTSNNNPLWMSTEELGKLIALIAKPNKANNEMP